MQILKIIQLIWTFYRNFLLLSAFITFLCLRAFWMYGFSSFFGIFWLKVLTMGATYYLIDSNKKNEYYYFQNLGVSKHLLWIASLSFDFVLFLFLLILTDYLQ